jgi:hypothetical protein
MLTAGMEPKDRIRFERRPRRRLIRRTIKLHFFPFLQKRRRKCIGEEDFAVSSALCLQQQLKDQGSLHSQVLAYETILPRLE